jgi:hypothetical protein
MPTITLIRLGPAGQDAVGDSATIAVVIVGRTAPGAVVFALLVEFATVNCERSGDLSSHHIISRVRLGAQL